MIYASLASGSKGNCHAFGEPGRVLLVDAGISLLQIKKRLELAGLSSSEVQGVAITHEHSDHIAALPVILRRTDWPVIATPQTLEAIQRIQGIEIPSTRWIPLHTGKVTPWHGWQLHPFTIPHDAEDPVALRMEAPGWSAAVVTDLGHPTELAMEHCKDLDMLILESNHDVEMLRNGEYPPHLKARILSRVGHLSNEACASFLARIQSPRLKHVVLAHLSESNNDPALARFAAQEALSSAEMQLHVASQGEPLPIAVAG